MSALTLCTHSLTSIAHRQQGQRCPQSQTSSTGRHLRFRSPVGQPSAAEMAMLQASREYQRVQIQFMMKLGMTGANIHLNLRRAHGAQTLSPLSVYRWMSKFHSGRQDCCDAQRSGRPTKITPEKLRQIQLLLNGDRTLSINRLSMLTNLGVATVHRALKKHLLLTKCPARWIPHDLTDAQHQRRVDQCRVLLWMHARWQDLLDHIVMGDESWLLTYDPATKQATVSWLTQGDCPLPKTRSDLHTQRLMLVCFFDSSGMIHHEFIERGLGIGAHVYLGVMRHLRAAVRRHRPVLWVGRHWWLQHDGAPTHRARMVQNFFNITGTQVLPHPGYSSDLAPSDYWLFSRVKRHIRGQRFDNVDHLRQLVDAVIGMITAAEYHHALHALPQRWRQCVNAQGHYFE